MRKFRRVLVANRGEIAIRIFRACREAALETVAVYSEADALAPHVTQADMAVCIGPPPSSESYLNIDRILEAARKAGAEAVHPGYGFLAESAEFAHAVSAAGLVFIGPPAAAVATMGDKLVARQTVAAAGVPVVPALHELPASPPDIAAAAAAFGYPIMIKAAAGGGGKGMRIARSETELTAGVTSAAREAQGAFGDARVFFERYLEKPRHVEVQILADNHGNVIHLGERECSIQRRHQKLVEETPSPAVRNALRQRLTKAAIACARSVGYQNAGTVEFLLDPSGQFYFLEMNTRLQVEHPVTELVTGIDIVEAQLRLASGEPLWLRQRDVTFRGHAMECRVYAEDPAQQFLPSPGTVLRLREPHGPAIRVDSGIEPGMEIPVFYDPLLAKISAAGEDREAARCRLAAALADYVVLGFPTCIPLLIDVLHHPAFIRGDIHTHFLEANFAPWKPAEKHRLTAAIAAAIASSHWRPPPPATGGGQQSASPWTTLGRWRVGEER